MVTVRVDGEAVRRFDIELAEGTPDWWTPLDVSAWHGQELTVVVDALPEDSTVLGDLRAGGLR